MVHRDPDIADRMLVALSELLRDGLSSEMVHMRPLREELELVQHYLMIEKIRLTERLVVEVDVPSECLERWVPALVLQPLVENAIVHGVSRRRAPSILRISARLSPEDLVLEVQNNVPPGTPTPGNGIGVANTRSRLALLYGDRATLDQRMCVDGLYRVRVVIPESVGAKVLLQPLAVTSP